MARAREEAAEVVVPIRRARRTLEGVPEVSVDASTRSPVIRVVEPAAQAAVDLSEKPKVWLMLGDGGTGKTTWIRWAAGRMAEQGRGALLAALDPGVRALSSWFDGIEEPPSSDPAQIARWFRELAEDLMEEPRPAICDFGGGGHIALSNLVEASPRGDIHSMLEGRGIGLVACYTLSPRIDDLGVLQRLEAAGFQPQATMLLLNTGRKDPTQTDEEAFEPVRRHSVYRRAVDRGAVPIWMPRLDVEAMQEIEAKRLSFVMARDRKVPKDAPFAPLGGIKHSFVKLWLDRMEEAHKPVVTWLP